MDARDSDDRAASVSRNKSSLRILDFGENRQGAVDVLAPMGRHQSEAQARGARRHGRRANTLREDSVFQKPGRELHTLFGIADHQREERTLRESKGKSDLRQSIR